MSRPLTLLTIVSSDSTEPEAIAHTQSWELTPALADFLIRKLTQAAGPPAEGLCPVGSMVDLAKVQGHTFLEPGESGADG